MDNNNRVNEATIALSGALGDDHMPYIAHDGLQQAVIMCSTLAAKSGWWKRRIPNVPAEVAAQVSLVMADAGFPVGGVLTAQEIAGMVPEKLCLSHSELSEAMEGHRKGLPDDKLPHRSMLEVELADTVIRVFDLAGALGLDLAGALIEKLAFNQVRPDHKPEAREAAGGKAY